MVTRFVNQFLILRNCSYDQNISSANYIKRSDNGRFIIEGKVEDLRRSNNKILLWIQSKHSAYLPTK